MRCHGSPPPRLVAAPGGRLCGGLRIIGPTLRAEYVADRLCRRPWDAQTLGPDALEAVPYSGAPRDRLIGELTDHDLGKLCDFDVCVTENGYRHDFCTDRWCAPYVPAGFHLETVPLLADALYTYYTMTADTAGSPSREECVRLYRNTFGACHVGQWEDCTRQISVLPLAGRSTPSCGERNTECGADLVLCAGRDASE